LIVGATASCGSQSGAPRHSVYSATTSTTAIRLVIDQVGTSVTGTIDIAVESATSRGVVATTRPISGTLFGAALAFGQSHGQPAEIVHFAGRRDHTKVTGVLVQGMTSERVVLVASNRQATWFSQQITALKARAKRTHAILVSSLKGLDSRAEQLVRVAHALGIDTSALDAAFDHELADADTARADIASTLRATKSNPRSTATPVCDSLATSITSTTTVTNDTSFVTGFVHGLYGTISNVNEAVVALAQSADRLGLNVTAPPTSTNSVNTAAITAAIQVAHAAATRATTQTAQIAQQAESTLTELYSALNAVIATTTCHEPSDERSPFPSGVTA
jgi:hypothetical protein